MLGHPSDWPVEVLGPAPVWISNAKTDVAEVLQTTQRGMQELVVLVNNQSVEACRKAGAKAYNQLKLCGIADASVWSNVNSTDHAIAFAEGYLLGSYRFEKYKSESRSIPCSLSIWHPFLENEDINAINIMASAVALTRNLVNEPASHLTAKQLSEAFEKVGKDSGFEVEVLGKNKIESLKMGGLLGVNQGSDLPPTFNILEYKPRQPKNSKPLVLVGKGVVYDTGGHSLKTSAGMEAMKCDMAGSATVLGIFKAISELALPVHIIGLVPATDNRISAAALSPGDVITMSNGKTVEVLNTDAEGRLILADALVFAQKYNPALVIDFATLTGAAARAIGKEGFVYMGTAEPPVKKLLVEAGTAVYERGVEFPLWDEYSEYLKSDIADLKNIGGAEAGAITAGKFLQEFVNYPWLHLDIAGTAFLEGGAVGYIPKGGTGTGVRLMVTFIRNWLEAQP